MIVFIVIAIIIALILTASTVFYLMVKSIRSAADEELDMLMSGVESVLKKTESDLKKLENDQKITENENEIKKIREKHRLESEKQWDEYQMKLKELGKKDKKWYADFRGRLDEIYVSKDDIEKNRRLNREMEKKHAMYMKDLPLEIRSLSGSFLQRKKKT